MSMAGFGSVVYTMKDLILKAIEDWFREQEDYMSTNGKITTLDGDFDLEKLADHIVQRILGPII
jgi:hypothetical protein